MGSSINLVVYRVHSPVHAESIALVLNPSTGHVSPQYHLVFDDSFTTIRYLRNGTVPPNWRQLVESSSFSSTDQQYSLTDTWLNQHSFDPENPKSAPPLSNNLRPSSSSASERARLVPSTPLDSPLSSKDDLGSAPLNTHVSEGASFPKPVTYVEPPSSLASEGGPTRIFQFAREEILQTLNHLRSFLIFSIWNLLVCAGLPVLKLSLREPKKLILIRKQNTRLNLISLVILAAQNSIMHYSCNRTGCKPPHSHIVHPSLLNQ